MQISTLVSLLTSALLFTSLWTSSLLAQHNPVLNMEELVQEGVYARMSWSKLELGISHWVVERRLAGEPAFEEIGQVKADTTGFMEWVVPEGQTYEYRVGAVYEGKVILYTYPTALTLTEKLIPIVLERDCSEADGTRRWIIINHNPVPVPVIWNTEFDQQQGRFLAPSGESTFTTSLVDRIVNNYANKVNLFWLDKTFHLTKVTKGATNTPCSTSVLPSVALSAPRDTINRGLNVFDWTNVKTLPLTVGPVPFTDELTLYPFEPIGPSTIRVLNTSGRVIVTEEVDLIHATTLEMGYHLPAGLYLIEVKHGKSISTFKALHN